MFGMFQQTYSIAGALAANHVFHFKTPCACSLVHVSAGNESANAGTLKIGTGADDDAYLLAKNFGVSSTPAAVNTPAGFDGADAGGQYPHIAAGTIVKITITDHASQMTAPCVVLTFTEG
jgi:hypothetical protein